MISIRRVVLPNDPAEAFIGDTLLRSYSDAANGGRGADPPREFAHLLFGELPDALARKAMWSWMRMRIAEGARLWLAYVPDDKDPLFAGWVCAAPGVLHYVYVKHNFRRRHIAQRLLGEPLSEFGAPLRRASVMTWPWVERWLARNGVTYQPIARDDHEHETAKTG